MARSSLGPLGVHIPETVNYQSGFLQHWLDMFGLASGEGCLAQLKLRDEQHVWYTDSGRIPSVSDATRLFKQEAEALGFKVMVQYNPWTLSNPGGDPFPERALGMLTRAASNLSEIFPNAIIAGPGNEPASGSWTGTDMDLWKAEGYFLRELKRRGHECAGFPYASIVTTASTAKDRFRVLKALDAIPDWWQAHLYGQGGDIPRHVADLRAALRRITGQDIPVIYGEYHYGFPGGGGDYDDRPDLLTADTGHYVADAALAMAAAGDAGVVFTLESMFWPSGVGTPNAAGAAFASSYANGSLLGTPRSVDTDDLRSKTFRLLVEERGFYMRLVGAPLIIQNLTYP